MRVIIAGRLSRKVADRDQHGLDGQERDSVAWAKAEGHEVIAVIADYKSGRSGLEARPNLKPWVTEPQKLALYDGIVALKVDRLTRGDREETSKLEQWARDHGKHLLIAGMNVRFPSEGNEGIAWDLMLRQAHQEWLNTSQRYKDIQRTIRDAGGLVGKPPYGFKIVKNGEYKTLVPDPTEAKVIQDAAGWYLPPNAMSLDDICDKLNAEGRLPRKWGGRQTLWNPVTLGRLLRNEVLIGRRTDKNGKTILKCEPILTRATWVAVKERMATRAHRAGVSQAKSSAMLTSIIKCMEHGNMYRTGSDVPGYYCHTKGCKRFVVVDRTNQAISEMMADDDRYDFTDHVIPGDNHDDEIADVKRDMAEAVEAEEFDRLPELQAELARLRALPSRPARIERIRSSQTLGEVWNALPDDNARRTFLLERSARVIVADGELILSIADDVEAA